MEAYRVQKTDACLRVLSDLFTEEHVFAMLDHRVKTFYGMYRLFRNIESGAIRVYAATEGKSFHGVCFGRVEEQPDTFVAHVAFLRGANAKEGCLCCEQAMIEDYKKECRRIRHIAGYIPAHNRAAILMAKRIGYRDTGIDNTKIIVHDGIEYPCHVLIKDFEV